jgi:hypothetical protein
MIEVIMRDTESGKVLYRGETKAALLFTMHGETGCDVAAQGAANAVNMMAMCMAMDGEKRRILREYEGARKLYAAKEQIVKGTVVFDRDGIRNTARRDPGK